MAHVLLHLLTLILGDVSIHCEKLTGPCHCYESNMLLKLTVSDTDSSRPYQPSSNGVCADTDRSKPNHPSSSEVCDIFHSDVFELAICLSVTGLS